MKGMKMKRNGKNCGSENSGKEGSHDYSLSKCFPSRLIRKSGVFKFHRFEERFVRETSVLVTDKCGGLA